MLASAQGVLVGEVGHHGAQQGRRGAEGHSVDQGVAPEEGHVARFSDEVEANLDGHAVEQGDLDGAILAEPVGNLQPGRHGGEAGQEVEEQGDAGVLAQLENVGGEEDVQGAGGGGGKSGGQVREQQPPKRSIGEDHLGRLLPLDGPVDDAAGVGHEQERRQRGQGKQDQAEPAHAGHLQRRLAGAEQLHHGRNGQHQGHAADHEHFPPTVKPGAVVVGGGQLRAPGLMGDGHHRVAHVQQHQPEPQVRRRHSVGIRHEHHPDRQHQQGHGDRNPVLAPPPTGVKTIDDRAHDWVGHHVPNAGKGEDQADGGEA